MFLAAVEVDSAEGPPACWRGGPSWTPVLGGPALPQVLLSLLEDHIHPCGGHPWPASLSSARWRQTLEAEGTRLWCCPASGWETGSSQERGVCWGETSARVVWGPQSLVLGTSTARTPSLSWRSAGERGGERARMNFLTGSTTSTIPN